MPKIMAHRGARDLWAENSLTGFRKTVALGFDAIEFDLHLTDEGKLVVIHDATLDRTTTGTGPVRALTDDARHALRLKGPDGAIVDEPVPTFDEALAILGQGTADLYVELKADEAGRPYPDIVARTAETLDRHGLRDRSVLHSFDIGVVQEIRDLAPDFRRLISVNQEWADRQGGIATFLRSVEGLVDVVGIHHAATDVGFIVSDDPVLARTIIG